MKKNSLKLLLDLAMLIVLVLMFKKTAISLSFHEIGGLALLGAFVFHLILNHKWITGVTKKLFSKTLPTKTRLGYIVDALLLVSFILIGLSGIFISKIVFHLNGGGMAWRTVHDAAAAVLLILMGVHLGLHAGFIGSVILKIMPVPKKPAAILGIILAVVVIGYGFYSIDTTSFVNWLTMPFSLSQAADGNKDHSFNRGAIPSLEKDKRSGAAPDLSKPGNGMMPSRPEGGTAGISASTILQTIASFFSISFVFAAVTFVFDKAIGRLKRRK